MAIVNLSPEEMAEMANRLQSWRMSLSELNNGVKNTISQMDGWKDPQHAMFLQTVEITHAQLVQYMESLERFANSMNTYARQQIEMREELRRQINSINS